jgi:hypothetical protein
LLIGPKTALPPAAQRAEVFGRWPPHYREDTLRIVGYTFPNSATARVYQNSTLTQMPCAKERNKWPPIIADVVPRRHYGFFPYYRLKFTTEHFIMRTAVLIGALVVCPAALLQADTIYSDLGSGFYPGAGDTVSSSANSSDQRPSVEFSPSVNEALIEVDFVTSIDASVDPNLIVVTLSNNVGGHPGTVIASQEFTGAMGILGSSANPPGIISWDPSTELELVAGADYWITLDGPTNSDVTWNYNKEGASGYTDFVSGSWQLSQNTRGAIDIIGSFNSGPSTPEPGTAFLLALGMTAAIGLSRMLQTRSSRQGLGFGGRDRCPAADAQKLQTDD